jgi:hypothetical protein
MNFIQGKCYSVPRKIGLRLINKPGFIGVDTYKDSPQKVGSYQYFNPFFFTKSISIPVPGLENVYAHSLESIWQGLKVVEGETYFDMFQQIPFKRPTDETRRKNKSYVYEKSSFHYKGKIINLLKARFFIYLKAYCYLLNNVVPGFLRNELKNELFDDKCIVFYDWDQNFDIQDITSSFSHSAILASWFNHTLEEDFLEPGYNLFPDFIEVLNVNMLDHY